MLPPRMMQALGGMSVLAGLLGGVATSMGTMALVVGVGLGIGLIAATFVGGGPQPIPEAEYGFEDAMLLLRRASVGSTLVAGAAVAVAASLWWLGGAGPVDVVVVFLLALLVVFASTIAAAGLILSRDAVAEE